MTKKGGFSCSVIFSAIIIFAAISFACVSGRWWLPDFFELLSSLAWPVVVLLIFGTLRKPIENLIKRIKKIKHNGTEIDIHEELDFVEEKIQENKEFLMAIPDEPPLQETNIFNNSTPEQPNSIFDTLWNLSHKQHKDMTSDFIFKWIEFEKFIRDFADKKKFQINNIRVKNSADQVILAKNAPFMLILRFLQLNEFLSHDDLQIIRSLSNIRNSIVHEGIASIGRQDLDRYLRSLDDIYKILKQKFAS